MQFAWNLDNITAKEHAFKFIRSFEANLCVFSPLVGQLYSTYEIHPTNNQFERLVVLPDTLSHHDNYAQLIAEASVATPFFILPSDTTDKAKKMLAKRNKQGRIERFDFNDAMASLMSKNPDFIPVLSSRNIKQLKDRMPIIPIHHLDMTKLGHLSEFARNNLKNRIRGKLSSLAPLQ